MKRKEALSIAIGALDIRADQWRASVEGTQNNCIDELYEADSEEAAYMENLCREAIKTLQDTSHDSGD